MFLLFFIFFFEFLFFNFFFFIFFLFFILFGGVLSFLERKYLSLVQRRVGPVFAGYKGRLQFLADALKVFLKEFIYLNTVNSYFYFFFPVFYFFLNLVLCLFLFYNNNTLLDLNNYLIYIYFFSFYSMIFLFFSSFFSKNKYSLISCYRIILFVFSLDFVFSIILLICFFFTSSFNMYLINTNKYFFLNLNSLINIFLYLLVFLIHVNKAPFDLFEAESELVAGYFIEYSGFLFGLFVLVEYFHVFFFTFFFSYIFL